MSGREEHKVEPRSMNNLGATLIASALSLLLIAGITSSARAPQDQGNHFFRQGNRAFDRGHFAAAVAAYTRALEHNPKSPKLLHDRALANEMVDRQAALQDWRGFLNLTGSDPGWTPEVTRVRERLRALEAMPALPETLQPGRYVSKAGDYYDQVAESSLGLQWTKFPVRVFVGSPPQGWQRTVQEAIDAWRELLPLQVVTTRGDADVFLTWRSLPKNSESSERAGSEQDLISVPRQDGGVVERRKRSFITLDASRRWSDGQMRANVLHELGHGLGIRGHSDNLKDVMAAEQVELIRETKSGADQRAPSMIGPSGVESTSLEAPDSPKETSIPSFAFTTLPGVSRSSGSANYCSLLTAGYHGVRLAGPGLHHS